jgi:hypothetical protein
MCEEANGINTLSDVLQDFLGARVTFASDESKRGAKCQRAHHIIGIVNADIIDDSWLARIVSEPRDEFPREVFDERRIFRKG